MPSLHISRFRPGYGGWLRAEFGFAVLSGILARTIDYSDSLLADKYTRYVSIQVMKHAAELDLDRLRGPGFLRPAGAGAGAGHRSSGNDSADRAADPVGDYDCHPCRSSIIVLLALADVVADRGRAACVSGREPFRVSRIRQELPADSGPAATGLSAAVLGGSKEAAKELKLFGLSKFLTDRFTRLSDGIYEENVALSRRKLIAGAFLSVIAYAGYYSAYVFVIWRTVAGVYSIGLWYLLTNAIVQASNNLQQIFSTLSGIADQALFLTDLLAFFDMQPTIRSKPDALPAPRPIVRGFEFRNVSFRYPGSSRLVLNGLNFHLHPGERVALIGENGEGKTTIVKLITRLYDPTEGQVLLDGVDLREYRLEDLYREIGVIFQDFMRYEMTARENIAVGQIEEIDDLKLLETAARKSLADAVIAKASQRLRSDAGAALRRRSRPVWWRVAEDCAGPRLPARCAASDSRRTDGRARCAQRVRSFPTLRRTHRRKDGTFYFTPILDRAHGRSHRSAGKRKDCRRGKSRPTGEPGRALQGNV